MLGCLYGAIVGDAFGSAYEFKKRDEYDVHADMQTNVFGLPPGSFTDDSSMLLCLASSLKECRGFEPIDQLNKYCDWKRNGYMSSSDDKWLYDIGSTTNYALNLFTRDRGTTRQYYGSTNPQMSGNGGIMRLAPVAVMYWYDHLLAGEYAALSSKTTHASVECLDAARMLGQVLALMLQGKEIKLEEDQFTSIAVRALAAGEYKSKSRDQIKTSGYVIHSLEAALWALHVTASYEEGIMLLAVMGGDVDTVCCIYGALAGAKYGLTSIPSRWVNALQKPNMVRDVIYGLVDATDV